MPYPKSIFYVSFGNIRNQYSLFDQLHFEVPKETLLCHIKVGKTFISVSPMMVVTCMCVALWKAMTKKYKTGFSCRLVTTSRLPFFPQQTIFGFTKKLSSSKKTHYSASTSVFYRAISKKAKEDSCLHRVTHISAIEMKAWLALGIQFLEQAQLKSRVLIIRQQQKFQFQQGREQYTGKCNWLMARWRCYYFYPF